MQNPASPNPPHGEQMPVFRQNDIGFGTRRSLQKRGVVAICLAGNLGKGRANFRRELLDTINRKLPEITMARALGIKPLADDHALQLADGAMGNKNRAAVKTVRHNIPSQFLPWISRPSRLFCFKSVEQDIGINDDLLLGSLHASVLAALPKRDQDISAQLPQSQGHFTSGGKLIRMASVLPPVFSPKVVPRS